jgi:hypothetical protein
VPGAGRHHDRRRARDRRTRHRDPGDRRGADQRSHVRLALEPDPVAHGRRLEPEEARVRAAALRTRRGGREGVPRAPRADDRDRGRAPRRRELEPPLPELRRHPGERDVRGSDRCGAGGRAEQLRELPGGVGPRRGDLVPVHRQPVAEGVERQPDAAGRLDHSERAVQLRLLGPAARPGVRARRRTCSSTSARRRSARRRTATRSSAGARTCSGS